MTSVTGVGKREIETPSLPGEDVLQVVDVLLPDGPVVEAEAASQLASICSGCMRALGAGEHAGDGVAGHEAREQEVQGDGGPEGDQVEPQAAQDKAHGFPPFGNCGMNCGARRAAVLAGSRGRAPPGVRGLPGLRRRSGYLRGSSVVRTSTVVGARTERVAYGLSSVGQPVKRVSL